MSDLGLLLSAPMVRAALDGSKRMTRRALQDRFVCVAVAPYGSRMRVKNVDSLHDPDGTGQRLVGRTKDGREVVVTHRYAPGDTVWFRETWWASPDVLADRDRGTVAYRADGEMPLHMADERWRSPIYMPRWAARLVFPLTTMRFERLQDISDADCVAEGVIQAPRPDNWCFVPYAGIDPQSTPRAAYAALWDSINGLGAWAANPWVVVFGW